MGTRIIAFRFSKQGFRRMFSRENAAAIPGLTGIQIGQIYGIDYTDMPDYNTVRQSAVLLVEFKDATGIPLYMVVKNNAEVPLKGEVVTKDLVDFLSSEYFDNEEISITEHNGASKLYEAVKRISLYWEIIKTDIVLNTAGRYERKLINSIIQGDMLINMENIDFHRMTAELMYGHSLDEDTRKRNRAKVFSWAYMGLTPKDLADKFFNQDDPDFEKNVKAFREKFFSNYPECICFGTQSGRFVTNIPNATEVEKDGADNT